MKKLLELCYNLNYRIIGNSDIIIKGISYHSQKTKNGDLFVAINGYTTTGKKYIESAVCNGAIAIATSDYVLAKKIFNQYNQRITMIYIKNPRQFLALTANRFFDFPSQKLNLIGITGTDGKTTTSYMIKSIIEVSGRKTGLLGTIKYFNGKVWLPAPNTTPESLDFIKFLYGLLQRKCNYCVSEISSHALTLDRVRGLDFSVAAFTNLAQDHLDFHKTIKAYEDAKLKLFKNLTSSSYAVINNDDKFAKKIINNTKAKIIKYSISNSSDIKAKIKNINLDGYDIIVNVSNKVKPLKIKLPMLGRHNVYNMLAAIATAQALKIPNQYIKYGVEHLNPIPGRLERIRTNKGFNIYVDYAHTEEALANVIRTLKETTRGKLIIVFGCGGNRDCTKRPKMGRVATELGDYAIITSDNPRNEDPTAIIDDIKNGVNKNNFEIIIDRCAAIKKALRIAKPTNTILIAGKGHEDYQIIGNRIIDFSDKETVLNELRKK